MILHNHIFTFCHLYSVWTQRLKFVLPTKHGHSTVTFTNHLEATESKQKAMKKVGVSRNFRGGPDPLYSHWLHLWYDSAFVAMLWGVNCRLLTRNEEKDALDFKQRLGPIAIWYWSGHQSLCVKRRPAQEERHHNRNYKEFNTNLAVNILVMLYHSETAFKADANVSTNSLK